MKISEIKRGDCFDFCGFQWIVIDPQPEGVYALLKIVPEILKRRSFVPCDTYRVKDISSWKYPSPGMCYRVKDISNWKRSTARYVLRHVFLPEMMEQIGQQGEKLLEMAVDLTALDGTARDTSTEIIALLSLGQYRQHVDIIGATHAEFWTLTRASAKIPDAVVTIKGDGTVRVDGNPKLSASELRPVILLAPESEVEKEVQTEDAQA